MQSFWEKSKVNPQIYQSGVEEGESVIYLRVQSYSKDGCESHHGNKNYSTNKGDKVFKSINIIIECFLNHL